VKVVVTTTRSGDFLTPAKVKGDKQFAQAQNVDDLIA
jgi:hypothetical protein